jgi:arylesterase / paraoxonase
MNTPNSILPLNENEILFTNDHKVQSEKHPILALAETFTAYPGGSLVHLNTKTNEAHLLASIPFANGIGLLNTTHVAVASSSLTAVLIYALNEDRKSITLSQKFQVPFCVDNLRVDGNGKLLMAGHPHVLTMSNVAKTNQMYDVDGSGEAGLLPGKNRPRAPSWVAEWDGNAEGVVKDLYVGHEFDTSSTAIRDVKRGVGFVTGLYGKGIMMWKE